MNEHDEYIFLNFDLFELRWVDISIIKVPQNWLFKKDITKKYQVNFRNRKQCFFLRKMLSLSMSKTIWGIILQENWKLFRHFILGLLYQKLQRLCNIFQDYTVASYTSTPPRESSNAFILTDTYLVIQRNVFVRWLVWSMEFWSTWVLVTLSDDCRYMGNWSVSRAAVAASEVYF